MQTPIREEELKKIEQRKHNRFDNIFIDALYNIISYLPAAIITWFVSNFDF